MQIRHLLQPRVRMHKGRLNPNASFSIGKTWPLDDLTKIESFTHMKTETPEQEQRKKLGGNSGFIVTIGKDYYWKANTQKEKDFFILSLIKIFKKYTGGKPLELVGFSSQELEQLGGIVSQSGAHVKPLINGSPSPRTPNLSTSARSMSRSGDMLSTGPRRQASMDKSSHERQASDNARMLGNANSSRDRSARSATPHEHVSSDQNVVQAVSPLRSRRSQSPHSIRPKALSTASRSQSQHRAYGTAPQDSDTAPPTPSGRVSSEQARQRKSSTSKNPMRAVSTSRLDTGEDRPRTADQDAPIPKKLSLRSNQKPDNSKVDRADPSSATRWPSSDKAEKNRLDRPKDLEDESFRKSKTQSRKADDSRDNNVKAIAPQSLVFRSPSSSTSSPAQITTDFSASHPAEPEADFRPGLGPMIKNKGNSDTASKFRKAALAHSAFKPRGVAETAKDSIVSNGDGVNGVSRAPSLLQTSGHNNATKEIQGSSTTVSDLNHTSISVEPSTSKSTEPGTEYRPGLGPMIKTKSIGDTASKFRKAALAYNAFKPRGSTPTEAAADTTASVGDGITGVFQAPSLLRGSGHDDAKREIQRPESAISMNITSSKDVSTEGAAPELQKSSLRPNVPAQIERQKKQQSDQSAKIAKSLGIDPKLLEGRTAEIENYLDDFGWTGQSTRTTFEDIETGIRNELAKVEAGSWLGAVEGNDARVVIVGDLMDKVIAECEELDCLLTLFSVELGTISEDVAYIEAQSQGLQVQAANERALQAELRTLLDSRSSESRSRVI